MLVNTSYDPIKHLRTQQHNSLVTHFLSSTTLLRVVLLLNYVICHLYYISCYVKIQRAYEYKAIKSKAEES